MSIQNKLLLFSGRFCSTVHKIFIIHFSCKVMNETLREHFDTYFYIFHIDFNTASILFLSFSFTQDLGRHGEVKCEQRLSVLPSLKCIVRSNVSQMLRFQNPNELLAKQCKIPMPSYLRAKFKQIIMGVDFFQKCSHSRFNPQEQITHRNQ